MSAREELARKLAHRPPSLPESQRNSDSVAAPLPDLRSVSVTPSATSAATASSNTSNTERSFGEVISNPQTMLGKHAKTKREHLNQQDLIQFSLSQISALSSASKLVDETVLEVVKTCLATKRAISNEMLLYAWRKNNVVVKQSFMSILETVLHPPILLEDWFWLQEYVLESSVWFEIDPDSDDPMYETLFEMVESEMNVIENQMNSMYREMMDTPSGRKLLDIPNLDLIMRQDDPKVGLVLNVTRDLVRKQNEREFYDRNLYLNYLILTARTVDPHFQKFMKTSSGLDQTRFRRGPLKNLDRCVEKSEQDYQRSEFPTTAQILDIIRCSYTFATPDQLFEAYQTLTRKEGIIQKKLKVARVKNKFLDEHVPSGYRDVKLNVVYKHNRDISIICEIQLLLDPILACKKRMHKLYTILRRRDLFRTVSMSKETVSDALTAVSMGNVERVRMFVRKLSANESEDTKQLMNDKNDENDLDDFKSLERSASVFAEEEKFDVLEGLTAAIEHGRPQIFDILLPHCENINATFNVRGEMWTLGHCVCQHGRKKMLRKLLDLGLDTVMYDDKRKYSPLGLVCRYGYAEMVQMILEKEDLDVNDPTRGGWTPLHLAVYYCQDACVEVLLNDPRVNVNAMTFKGVDKKSRPEEEGMTPLNLCIMTPVPNRLKIITMLMSHPDIDVNIMSPRKDSSIALAVDRLVGSDPTAVAAHERLEIVKILAANPVVDVCTYSTTGWNALHNAAGSGHEECVRVLLERTDIAPVLTSRTFHTNETPLELAKKRDPPSAVVVQMLEEFMSEHGLSE